MYEKALVAIDRSENSKRAPAAARELASLSDGEVRVFHLREQEVIARMGLIADESPEEAHRWLESAVDELRNAGVKAGRARRHRRPRHHLPVGAAVHTGVH